MIDACVVQEHYDNLADPMSHCMADELSSMWKADWDFVHCPFHSAGYHLDPEYVHLDKDEATWTEFNDVANRSVIAGCISLLLLAVFHCYCWL